MRFLLPIAVLLLLFVSTTSDGVQPYQRPGFNMNANVNAVNFGVIEITDASVLSFNWEKHPYAVVLGYVPECDVCGVMYQIMRETATNYDNDVLFAMIDRNMNPSYRSYFEVYDLPQVRLFKKGIMIHKFTMKELNDFQNALAKNLK